jgi:hypothetical protein
MASDLARLSSADSRSTSWRCRSFDERSRIKDSHYPRKALPRSGTFVHRTCGRFFS